MVTSTTKTTTPAVVAKPTTKPKPTTTTKPTEPTTPVTKPTTTTTAPKERPAGFKKSFGKKQINKENGGEKKPFDKKPTTPATTTTGKKPYQGKNHAESSRDTFSKKFFGTKDKKEGGEEQKSTFQKREQPYQKKDTTENKAPYQKKFEQKPRERTTTTTAIPSTSTTITEAGDVDRVTIESTISKNPTFTKAQQLYTKKVEDYLQDFKKSGSRDDQWKEKIQHTGTIRDRISAITLLVQKAPMYRLASLDILLNLAAKKSEREREFAINSLKDLFVNSLLPGTKLKRFNEREGIENSKSVELIQWYFEDLLKARYQAYIRLLEILAKDTVSRIRLIATSTVQYLLMNKPEQEEVLLTLLVNKLGDSEGGNSSKVIKLLEKLLDVHPAMKLVVVREVELFLYRSNNSNKAQYSALYFLNRIQVACDKDGTSSVEIKELSHRLISLYLTFFANKSSVNSSSISLIIFGIRKAYAITQESTVFEPTQLKSLFKSCRKNTINKVIQTLCLIFEIKQHTPEITKDFYSNLYHTLNRLEKLSQFDQTTFLNLIFRSIKHDDNQSRAMSVLKRLLQFSFHQVVSFSASTLILVSELIKFNPEFGKLVNTNTQTPIAEDDETTPKYDSFHHDPVQANGHLSCLWEITLYSLHQHPMVASFANDILNSNPIKFQGNPTVIFTLTAFVEKFVLSRAKNRKAKSDLKITKSKIAQQYSLDGSDDEIDQDDEDDSDIEEEDEELEQITNNRPVRADEKFLKTFGDISTASGVSTSSKKKGSIQFVKDDAEMDKVLGYKTDGSDEDEDDSDLDAEYSYEDLEASDFDDEEFESEIPTVIKKATIAKKGKTPITNDSDEDDEEFGVDDEEFAAIDNDQFLDSIPDDDDDEDEEEDNSEDIDDEDLDGDEEDGDGTFVDTPDFGDEGEIEEDDDDIETPDFGDEDDEEDGDDGEQSDFIKSMQDNDSFMDADEFQVMLEKSGGGKSSYKKNGGKAGSNAPSKKSIPSKKPTPKSSTPKQQPKKTTGGVKRKRF